MQPSQDQTLERDADKGMHLAQEGVEKGAKLTAQTLRILRAQLAKFNNRVSIKFESRADDIANVKAGMKGGLKGAQLRQIVRAGNSIKEVAQRTQSAEKVKLYEDRVMSRAQHELNRDKVEQRRSQQSDQSQKQSQKQSQSMEM
ncbi:hypothetical protein HRE53_31955 (plasmid) [Acaryochloris sp. 'Moss Beach']|uniref:hypothetical protein n=1 Tax=Acaryochloris sp. 'Moss Beach' TaxID=2740837 RepID=UPI001F30E981|nr:hypothetical protein [Acaryochloris sp. 'Moss Beach']UJB73188.1 hypothetical protein HRE53_31955 [Acaryochloris sp. 'Moss Beach']